MRMFSRENTRKIAHRGSVSVLLLLVRGKVVNMLGASKYLRISLGKCIHIDSVDKVGSVNLDDTIADHFLQEHGIFSEFRAWSSYNGKDFDLDRNATFQDLLGVINLDNISYQCADTVPAPEPEEIVDVDDDIVEVGGSRNENNAFTVLMRTAVNQSTISRKRGYPVEKPANNNRKTELYNDLVRSFQSKQLDFPYASANTEGKHCIEVLSSALWYITNHHQTIEDRCRHVSGLIPVPSEYGVYTGYNDTKRKKTKSDQLEREKLRLHSGALHGLLMKPYMNSSDAWREECKNLESLAKCLHNYAEYLNTQNIKMKSVQSASSPARTLDEDTSIQFRPSNQFVEEKYDLINSVMVEVGKDVPVVFDEDIHLKDAFENNMQRFRYFADMSLDVPIDILRFSPGGSSVTIYCIVQRTKERSVQALLTDGAQVLQKMRSDFKEYHTRAEKRLFKKSVKNLCSVNGGVLEEIYKLLALDSSASSHPATGQRIRAIMEGERGLIADMRHLNPGRPSNKYDVFFEHMKTVVEELTAADERRHNVAHMSEFLSIRDLIDRVASKCPPDTPIPSKSLVRLQFVPTNPYARTALAFSSKFDVQHKIQRRQLRVDHPDNHYCAALFRYFKHRAVEERSSSVVFFCDDKAKVPVGEPAVPVSTGVRGRMSIVPTATTLGALDHDMHKASLTPSVVLECRVPETVDQSFVRGEVTVSINDSVFEGSDPFRHAVMLSNMMNKGETPPILMKFTDGGTDQRCSLEKVKCATICLFKKHNFDMMIIGRCAPGQSYTNPCERIMSTLNYGLQNCATERERCSDEIEAKLKRCNSMASIRNLNDKSVRESWLNSLKLVKSEIERRFERLVIKDEPVNCVSPVMDAEIQTFQLYLKELFPNLDITKLQRDHTKKVMEYNAWKANHCIENRYLFMIRKCDDISCCPAKRLPQDQLRWLPSPIMEADGKHYKKYEEISNLDVSDEKHRPSLQVIQKKSNSTQASAAADVTPSTPTSSTTKEKSVVALSAQNARAQVVCTDCSKPRVVYCNKKLDIRHRMMIAKSISNYDYTCGSHLFSPSDTRKLALSMVMRPHLQCAMQIEICYYGSDVGRKDLCSHCGTEGAIVNAELKKSFKTVLPICDKCISDGKKPFTQRPFGKTKNQQK